MSQDQATVADLPPAELRERVSGTRDAAWFVESGARTVAEWRRALELAGMDITAFPTVVDFGCGCGRALQHLAKLAPRQTVIGMDTDAAAIAWLRAQRGAVQAHALPTLPPSPLPAASVDLVLSHSVFTHLPEDVQFAWLADLARILRPGGVLVASLHGEKAFNQYFTEIAPLASDETLASMMTAMTGKGFYHVFGRTEAEQTYPQYYGAAFHSIAYVVRAWLAEFELIAWHETYALEHQDVVLLRRKPGRTGPGG